MTHHDVTLSDQARRQAARSGLDEIFIRRLRAGETTSYETPQFAVHVAELGDGRAVRLFCQVNRTTHVVRLRVD